MAIYHCQVKLVKRSAGRSVTAAAAYRSGTRIEDTRTGEIHDYTRKRDVDHSVILTPEQAPAWMQERDTLWNNVEAVENRKNSQLAREFEVALPCELNREQQQTLVKNFAQDQFVDQGMVADIAFHHIGGSNPHAHILLTMREVTEEGFGKKNRAWNERALVGQWRERWADAVNQSLERAGHEQRVDHRSLRDQGLERLPTKHLGPTAHAMEKKGKSTERGDLNRVIEAANRFQAQNRTVLQQLDAQIIDLEQERAVRVFEQTMTPTERYCLPLRDCQSFTELGETYRAQRAAVKADRDLSREEQGEVYQGLRQAFRQVKPGIVAQDVQVILTNYSGVEIQAAYTEAFQEERGIILQRSERLLDRISWEQTKLQQWDAQHTQKEPAYPSGVLKRFREKAYHEWLAIRNKLRKRLKQLSQRWTRVNAYREPDTLYEQSLGGKLAKQKLRQYSPALLEAKQEVDRVQEREAQKALDEKIRASVEREKAWKRELGLPEHKRRDRSRGMGR